MVRLLRSWSLVRGEGVLGFWGGDIVRKEVLGYLLSFRRSAYLALLFHLETRPETQSVSAQSYDNLLPRISIDLKGRFVPCGGCESASGCKDGLMQMA